MLQDNSRDSVLKRFPRRFYAAILRADVIEQRRKVAS